MDKIKYYHIRPQSGTGGTTIAYYLDHETKTVYYNVARCGPYDNFCYRIGRKIAAGRLDKHGPVAEYQFTDWKDVKQHWIEQYDPEYVAIIPTEVVNRPSLCWEGDPTGMC